MRRYSRSLFIGLVSVVVSLPSHAVWVQQQQDHMGTRITVEVWCEEKPVCEKTVAEVMAEMARIDNQMSPYKPDSELSQLNQKAADKSVRVSSELFMLLQKSAHVSEITNGAFDITFASVGHFYDYRNKDKPNAAVIKESINAVNFRHVALSAQDNSVRYLAKGVKIDLGGIAKGYAVNNAIQIFKANGIKHGLVMAGGDSAMLGDKRGKPWMVGIQDPRDKTKQAVVIPLDNTAMSTSGDYERYFIEDGERYHHIIHPKTGRSAQEVQSVSIIGPDSTMTDALSTSVFVLGVEKGLALLNTMNDYDAIIVDNKRKLHYSDGLLAN